MKFSNLSEKILTVLKFKAKLDLKFMLKGRKTIKTRKKQVSAYEWKSLKKGGKSIQSEKARTQTNWMTTTNFNFKNMKLIELLGKLLK